MQLRFKVAGMSDMGLVRTNNEDNFQIARDLSVEPMRWINNEACLLTPYGTLLVVADGMGGMNAGEVASQIAIDTIRQLFTPANISTLDLNDVNAVNGFLSHAVVEADRCIKMTAAERPETHGMGTTIVIAWLLDGNLYVAWCGDSRAYIFNTATGLRRLTKDHSYVQTLVDAGKLTEEQAFDYPQSNIITRCLSDSPTVAEPEVMPIPYQVADGDVVLLCTDGLCGMIRDNEIETILRNQPPNDLTATVRALIDGALAASGADNVTITLLQVVSGGIKPNTRTVRGKQPNHILPAAAGSSAAATTAPPDKRKKSLIWIAGGGILAGIAIATLCFTWPFGKSDTADNTADIDLISGRDSVLDSQNTDQTAVDNTLSSLQGLTVAIGAQSSADAPDSRQEIPDAGKVTPADKDKRDNAPANDADGKQPGAISEEKPNSNEPVTEGGKPGSPAAAATGGRIANSDESVPPPPRAIQEYTVRKNEDIKGILKKFNMTAKEFKELNGESLTTLTEGQKIKVYKKK